MANINKLAAFSGKALEALDISASGNVLLPYDLQVQNELSFNGGAQVLNSAKLDLLLGGVASDAGSLHNHDGQYFTEAELSSSTSGSSGATLIKGDNKAYANISGLTTFTLQDFIDQINSALATAGGTEFDDASFKIIDSAGDGLGVTFDVSAITTADKVITMPDANVDLGDIATLNAASHAAVTLNAGAATQDSASLSGQELTLNQATVTTDGVMSSEDKVKLDGIETGATADQTGAEIKSAYEAEADTNAYTDAEKSKLGAIEAGATADQIASEVPFTPNGDIAASDVQAAIQEVRDDTDTKLGLKLDLTGGTMSGAIAMGGSKITGLGAPTATADAATKGYVDSALEGLKPKEAVRVASTANVLIASELEDADVIDGVTLATGDRVLLKNQTAASENGIYVVVASGAASRSLDFDSLSPIDEINGSLVAVQEGTANAGKVFVQTGSVVTLDTDDINFVFYNSSSSLVGGDGITVSGSNISIDHDGEGLAFSANQLALELDGTTLSKSASGIKVADGGIVNAQINASAAIAYSKLNLAGSIVAADLASNSVETAKIADDAVTAAKIASDVAGIGLGQNVDGSLEINVDDVTVEVSTDTLQVKDSGISSAKIADDAVTAAKINADVAGDGLSQGASGELNVDGVVISATNANAGTIAAGSFVRISAAGSFDIAQADSVANSTGIVGVLLASTATTATGKIQISGIATVLPAGAESFSAGEVWLSKAEAGKCTQLDTGGEQSATGNTITSVGIAIGTNQVVLNIGRVIEVV